MQRGIVDTPVFLMSPPREDWGLRGRANFRSRQAGGTTAEHARSEWSALADAIVASGADVLVCPPSPDPALTGMIYTAEAGELYRSNGELRFILPNMAVEHRRGESECFGRFMESLGVETEEIDALWEGQGDAIRGASGTKVVHTFGVGPEARTEKAAYDQVAERLSRRHVQIAFRADPWFHGNTFINVYLGPAGETSLLVVCPAALPDEEYERLLEFLAPDRVHEILPEQSLAYDTNSLQIGESVICPSTLSEATEAALRNIGLRVMRLAMPELFEKGGGAPVCLTNRLWGVDAREFPPEKLWSVNPAIPAHTWSG